MGIFDNATSVVIGNKEVQSIIGPNGEVFYQKPVSHSYALSFSSASYQTDSSGDVTVSVTLTDNGVPVSGETVSFSDGSSVYTGITNNSGVATCTLNYLNNGTVTASYSNVSASASVVSNYQPSVTLTEPISYTVVDNTSDGWFDLLLCPCIVVGDPVTSISGLYNPPMTNEELYEWWTNEFADSLYAVSYMDGEPMGEITGDLICYAISYDYYEDRFYTINYSTTTGYDITITVSDN